MEVCTQLNQTENVVIANLIEATKYFRGPH